MDCPCADVFGDGSMLTKVNIPGCVRPLPIPADRVRTKPTKRPSTFLFFSVLSGAFLLSLIFITFDGLDSVHQSRQYPLSSPRLPLAPPRLTFINLRHLPVLRPPQRATCYQPSTTFFSFYSTPSLLQSQSRPARHF